MRIERVVLEDKREVAIARVDVVCPLSAEVEVAPSDAFEAGNHAQRGRLAATGGPEQNYELAVADMQVDVIHRLDVGGIGLADVFELDVGHGLLRQGAHVAVEVAGQR